MRRERAGDLYASHGPAIYARCLRLLGDRASAEDATQETFLRVHVHLDDAPDRHSLAWIYRVATNLCLTLLRDRKPGGELPENLAIAGDVEGLLADRVLAAQLVARTSEKHREVAWLRYVDGLGLDEIGEVLGVTPRTVTNRLLAFAEEARRLASGGSDG